MAGCLIPSPMDTITSSAIMRIWGPSVVSSRLIQTSVALWPASTMMRMMVVVTMVMIYDDVDDENDML